LPRPVAGFAPRAAASRPCAELSPG
jgi:hypothetical protein